MLINEISKFFCIGNLTKVFSRNENKSNFYMNSCTVVIMKSTNDLFCDSLYTVVFRPFILLRLQFLVKLTCKNVVSHANQATTTTTHPIITDLPG